MNDSTIRQIVENTYEFHTIQNPRSGKYIQAAVTRLHEDVEMRKSKGETQQEPWIGGNPCGTNYKCWAPMVRWYRRSAKIKEQGRAES